MFLRYSVNGSHILVDNITEFTVINRDNEIQPTTATVQVQRGNDSHLLVLTDRAYLMNDNGKTIERIV
jgi:hypothetical protein